MDKKKGITIFASLFLGMLMAAPLLAQEKTACEQCSQGMAAGTVCQEDQMNAPEKGNQALCPIMGNQINKEVYVDFQGKRIYFCCKGCIATFNKEPEKYMKKMKDEGVVLASAVCPVTGEAANPEIFIEHEGTKYYFCCEDCKKKFQADPDTYLQKDMQEKSESHVMHEKQDAKQK